MVELSTSKKSVAIIAIVLGAILEPVTQIDLCAAVHDATIRIDSSGSASHQTQDPARCGGVFKWLRNG
jgi:hypothetical protein